MKWAVGLLLFWPGIAGATAPVWQMDQTKSEIRWLTEQDGNPISGGFRNFSAEIAFGPDNLAESKVTVTVDMTSVTADYAEVETILPKPEWFAAETFPQAVFETQSFKALGDQTYEVEATLTIKGKKVPVTLNMAFETLDEKHVVMTGQTTVKRTDFGIGWEETDDVSDAVDITVKVTANR